MQKNSFSSSIFHSSSFPLLFAFLFLSLLFAGCVSQQQNTSTTFAANAPAKDVVESTEKATKILAMLNVLDLETKYENTTSGVDSTIVYYSTHGTINKREVRGMIAFTVRDGKVVSVINCPLSNCSSDSLDSAFADLNATFPANLQIKLSLQQYFAQQPPVKENNGQDFLEYDYGFTDLFEQGLVVSYAPLNETPYTWDVELNLSLRHGPKFESKAHCTLVLDPSANDFSSVESCIDSLYNKESQHNFTGLPKCEKREVNAAFIETLPNDIFGNGIPRACVYLTDAIARSLKDNENATSNG